MSEATPVFELWRAGILTFEAAGTYDNPFLDVEIWAAFSAPSGRVIRREAYWDGGNVWRVSFAPTEPGAWAYTLEAPEKTGLDGRAGDGLPDKFGLAHAVGGQALHEVGVFFFGHTGLDDVGAVGRVVAFGQ